MRVAKIPRYEGGAIGLPEDGRFIPITNSERSDGACPTKWWFRHGEGLIPEASNPMKLGSAWDAFWEDLHLWFAAADSTYPEDGAIVCVWCPDGGECSQCEGTRRGPIARYAFLWRKAAIEGGLEWDKVEHECERVQRAAEGYLRIYGREPYSSYRVVAAQVPLARPILNPRTGRLYSPETILVEFPDGHRRRARTGEVPGRGGSEAVNPLPPGARLVTVRWPYYQIGKLDGLAVHRRTGAALVLEAKYVGAPKRLIEGLSVDPQTVGYLWLLEYSVRAGIVPGIADGAKIAGYLYDVAASTYHYDPEPLKKGGLSVAKNRTVPSWRFDAAVHAMGLDPDTYREHVNVLRATVDERLFRREMGAVDDEAILRYHEEMFAVAKRHAEWWRATARAATATDIYTSFPRVPVCRQPGGSCPYRGPCIADGVQARARFDVDDGLSWGVAQKEEDAADAAEEGSWL